MISVKAKNILIVVVVVSVVIKLILAIYFELSNDEVYYWVHALFPSWSYFDHPPLVGLLIRLSTLNLTATHDFFVRLGPMIISIVNVLLIFRIGKKLKDQKAGLISALLYSSSFYFAFSGFMAMPDTTLLLFWILSVSLGLDILRAQTVTNRDRASILRFGLTAGLAMLSKYTGVFTWFALGLGILVYNRKWLSDWSVYAALLISLLIFFPVLIWNIDQDFVSFTYQSNRVTPTVSLQFDYFLRELLGQLAYQNPLNFIFIVPALVALFKKRIYFDKKSAFYLLANSLPIIVMFLAFALFRKTLPHWSGPGYLGLILITGVYWSYRIEKTEGEKEVYPYRIFVPLIFYTFIAGTLLYLINFSGFSIGEKEEISQYGKNELSNDMYGWKHLGRQFGQLSQVWESKGIMDSSAHIISYRWFPGAHIHRYIGHPINKKVFLIGELNDIHDYYWINQKQRGLQEGHDYYHIALSNYYRDPEKIFGQYFDNIIPLDTLPITRNHVLMRYAFVYKLENYHAQ